MYNSLVASIFRDIAKILEIKGDNVFRIRAYDRAAQNIESLTEDIEHLVSADRLTEIPGIGKDLADKINEIVRTGKLVFFEELKKSIPEGLLQLLTIPSVGPKTAKLLYEQLKIESIADLEEAINQHKLDGIFGIKEKTIENIVHGIALVKRGRERMTLASAMQVSAVFMHALRKLSQTKRISEAGSLRRRKETVRDIDILVISGAPKRIMDTFISLPEVVEVIALGDTKSSVRTKDDVQIDCRVVEERSFGAALLYFTGSKNFNIKLRQLAIKKGLKVNEYGVFKGEKFVCGRTEEEIFKYFGMQYIPPELREDTGEIEAALKSGLPDLVTLDDIKGDLHVHSEWSDGNNTIEEMAHACRKKGYAYVAVTDHSQGLKVAGGLSEEELIGKKKEIDKLNAKLKNFKILFGAEVDIDGEGNLDYKDKILKQFDVVVGAIHNGFKQSKEKLTRRIIKACMNKYVNIIAHPTGKLWGEREAYEIDIDEVCKAARDTNTHLEINSYPQRLDLNDVHSRRAKEMGVRVAINTDSHLVEQLDNMSLGLSVARRGWLSREDVLNTLSLEELLRKIKK